MNVLPAAAPALEDGAVAGVLAELAAQSLRAAPGDRRAVPGDQLLIRPAAGSEHPVASRSHPRLPALSDRTGSEAGHRSGQHGGDKAANACPCPWALIAGRIRARVDVGELKPDDQVLIADEARSWNVPRKTAALGLRAAARDGRLRLYPGHGYIVVGWCPDCLYHHDSHAHERSCQAAKQVSRQPPAGTLRGAPSRAARSPGRDPADGAPAGPPETRPHLRGTEPP